MKKVINITDTEQYLKAKESLNNELNNNSTLFNTVTETKPKSNLINFQLRNAIFAKSDVERKEIKKIKKELNNKGLFTVTKMDQQREIVISKIVSHEPPRFNCSIRILKKK